MNKKLSYIIWVICLVFIIFTTPTKRSPRVIARAFYLF
nr:MAG TPA: hypothetical protein [Caudoviricetes sp.]